MDIKDKIIILNLLIILLINNCQNIEKTYENSDIDYRDKFYTYYDGILKYNGETFEYYDEVIIENISFPLFHCGIRATAVEISTINKKDEKENYYILYLDGYKIEEIFITGGKYIFYYEIEEIKNSIYAGEEMKNIRDSEVKWLRKYLKLEE